MADVLTYVLHYEGEFNKNSLGAVSEGAARAKDVGGECHAVVVGGDDLTDDLCKTLGQYGATDQRVDATIPALEQVMQQSGKTFQKYLYEGAGHAFFSVDRPSYRVDAAKDGWKQIWSFFGNHLQGA